MRHALGELAVVREDDQALGVVVEPADRIEVALDAGARQQIDHRRPALRVRPRADHAARLVNQQVPALGRLEPAAVDLDLVAIRIGLGAELRDTTGRSPRRGPA